MNRDDRFRLRTRRFEILEDRRCLSSLSFVHTASVECCYFEVRSLHAADMDEDGDLDVIANAQNPFDFEGVAQTGIVLFENIGDEGFASSKIISNSEFYADEIIRSADIDGDGDRDLIGGGYESLIWIENLGNSKFGNAREIASKDDPDSPIDGLTDLLTVDVDGDGDTDLLSASTGDGKIAWYENTDGEGSFGPEILIGRLRRPAISVGDLDNDGDIDVLAGTLENSRLVWFENADGEGNFGSADIIARQPRGLTELEVADVDGDGDLDVISSSAYATSILLYRNIDGLAEFSSGEQIETIPSESQHDSVTNPRIADIDGDGDQDLVASVSADSGKMRSILWVENVEGTFSGVNEIGDVTYGIEDILVADFDNDGSNDAIAAQQVADGVVFYRNESGIGEFNNKQYLTSGLPDPGSIKLADLDGDSDLDLITSTWQENQLVWRENISGTFGVDRVIDRRPMRTGVVRQNEFTSIQPADLDDDGDTDLLVSAYFQVDRLGSVPGRVLEPDPFLAWYENEDGHGSFGRQLIIVDDVQGPEVVIASDIDGDGDLDVLSALSIDDKLIWIENLGGGGFGEQRIVSDDVDKPLDLVSADFDGDGDNDVVSVSAADGRISWYANDGKGEFGQQQIIQTEFRGGNSVIAADFDGDGDMDVAAAASYRGESPFQVKGGISWFENMDGLGNFSAPIRIDSRAVSRLAIADVDVDGDTDVISTAFANSVVSTISWYENTGGSFRRDEITMGDKVFASGDIDGDDLSELISGGTDGLAIYRQRVVGDSNGDGVFNSADLVAVFVAGKYDDNIYGNASFSEGDWNGDGEFDSSDLVFAFRSGNFLRSASEVIVESIVFKDVEEPI